ncbi:MAG: aminotransferase class III-fold pyridoxal phosphate-dependent enzyme, partial [Anaerolineae bacterium]
LGLMVATEFTRQSRPDAALAQAATRAALARGLLLLTCGTWGNVVRWIPPLIVSAAQIDSALHTFADALASASA